MKKEYEADALAWKELHTEQIIRDNWIDFRKTAYQFPDGSVYEPFYSYSRRDSVVIVASDTDGKYLCVRQFRQGIREVTTEFPAGGIERTDGNIYGGSDDLSGDEAFAAAKRELMEETGYESDDWKHLLTIPSDATISNNYAHLFIAKNCRKTSGQSLDEAEFLNVEKYSSDQIDELIRAGRFQQAVHIAAWFLSKCD